MDGELLFSQKKSRFASVLVYIAIFLMLALIIFMYYIGSAIVEKHSMENTLNDKQRVVLLLHGYTLERGDIITCDVYDKAEKEKVMLIKRVIGLEGDKLLFVRRYDGRHVDLYMCEAGKNKFSLMTEPYIKDEMTDTRFDDTPVMQYTAREEIESIDLDTDTGATARIINACAITVQKDSIFYMGDNRNNSKDARSRDFGPCKTSEVTGKVIDILEPGSTKEGFIAFLFPKR